MYQTQCYTKFINRYTGIAAIGVELYNKLI